MASVAGLRLGNSLALLCFQSGCHRAPHVFTNWTASAFLLGLQRGGQLGSYADAQEVVGGPLGGTEIQRALLTDTGTAAFPLIFHPRHIAKFDIRCEGQTELRGGACMAGAL